MQKQIFLIFNDCQDMLQNVDEIISWAFPVNGVFIRRLTNIEVDFILQSFFLNNNRIARLKLSLKLVLNSIEVADDFIHSSNCTSADGQKEDPSFYQFRSSCHGSSDSDRAAIMVSQLYALWVEMRETGPGFEPCLGQQWSFDNPIDLPATPTLPILTFATNKLLTVGMYKRRMKLPSFFCAV